MPDLHVDGYSYNRNGAGRWSYDERGNGFLKRLIWWGISLLIDGFLNSFSLHHVAMPKNAISADPQAHLSRAAHSTSSCVCETISSRDSISILWLFSYELWICDYGVVRRRNCIYDPCRTNAVYLHVH